MSADDTFAATSLRWDSGPIVGVTPPSAVYGGVGRPGAAPLESNTRYHWRVEGTLADGSTATQTATFRTGLLNPGDWAPSAWITGGLEQTLLRTEFSVPADAKTATLYVSGIGYFEAELNGVKVGDHQLDVGWTDYTKRVYYSSFDVSGMLKPGSSNALGVSLGNGWWSCGPSPGTTQPHCDNGPPQLRLLLVADGVKTPLAYSAAGTWKASKGPITYNSLYNGEHYDARVAAALAGWSGAGFDDGTWAAATNATSAANGAVISSQLFEPIRHLARLPPASVGLPASDVQVFDFGQNMAGVVALTGLKCAAGQNVTIRHAEVLQHPPYGPKDGNIYVGNLRGAQATDIYTCRGDGTGEDYTPTFTQHGFRYAEVTGLGAPLMPDQIRAVEMHTALSQHSAVEFGTPLLNKIQHAVLWGQKSNVMSVPTDCPQRDERRGWTGDAALTAEEALYNYGMGAVYTHWLDVFPDDQAPNGGSNDFVPALGGGEGAPNWQSAFPTLIWGLLTYYGDGTMATKHFDALGKYYDNLEAEFNSTGAKGFRTGYGDWVVPPPHPMGDKHLIGMFALLHDLQMGEAIFSAVPSRAEAARRARLASLHARAAADFHATFYDAAKGYYGSGLQTEQSMPLYLGIVPAAVKSKVFDHLVHDIEVTNGGHTTSGIIGIKCALEVLSAAGRTDVALRMLARTDYPSYGFMITHPDEPATTIWELWDSPTEGPGMNSRNHIMFGTVGSWFYKWLLGVTPLAPGYAPPVATAGGAAAGANSSISVRPSGIGEVNLTRASGSVYTPLGDVTVAWALNATTRRLDLNTTIPPTALATVGVAIAARGCAPKRAADVTITEGGHPVWKGGKFVPGVAGVLSGALSADAKAVDFQVQAGAYAFAVSL